MDEGRGKGVGLGYRLRKVANILRRDRRLIVCTRSDLRKRSRELGRKGWRDQRADSSSHIRVPIG